jgi:hypothetical protein
MPAPVTAALVAASGWGVVGVGVSSSDGGSRDGGVCKTSAMSEGEGADVLLPKRRKPPDIPVTNNTEVSQPPTSIAVAFVAAANFVAVAIVAVANAKTAFLGESTFIDK